jgi:hypothetical protein
MTFCAHCGGSTLASIAGSPAGTTHLCSCGFTVAGRQRITDLEKELGQWRAVAESFNEAAEGSMNFNWAIHEFNKLKATP